MNDAMVIIAGLRYSGRSLLLQRLELAGLACVDNLPPPLLESYALSERGMGSLLRAVALDSSRKGSVEIAIRALDRIREAGIQAKLVFLEAGDSVIKERHGESGREAAPYSPEDLYALRSVLSPLKERADLILDSSYLSPQEERDRVIALIDPGMRAPDTTVAIESFGYRYGAARGELILDARFIPNPYYVAALRSLNGKDKPCSDYVLGQACAREALEGLVALCKAMIPEYKAQGRGTLRVAIGCTGGQHRSVALAEALFARLRGDGVEATLSHREMVAGRY